MSGERLAQDLKIPESIAAIEDFFDARSHRTPHLPAGQAGTAHRLLILIQDAHTNTSAQINIAGILEHVFRQTDAEYVFLEAGWGDESLSPLRQYGTPETRRQKALALLRKGKLQGPELFDLTTDQQVKLWGVESPAAYLESLKLYQEVAAKREEHVRALSRIKRAAEELKPHLYLSALLDFDHTVQAYRKHEVSQGDYAHKLKSFAVASGVSPESLDHFVKLLALTAREAEMDFERINTELREVMANLSEPDRLGLKTLVEELPSGRPLDLSHHSPRAFFYALKSLLPENKTDYKALRDYIDYLKEAGALDIQAILSEQARLEKEIFRRFTASSPDAARLHEVSQNTDLLIRLAGLEISAHEFEPIRRNEPAFNLTRMTAFLNQKIFDLGKLHEHIVFLDEELEAFLNKCKRFYKLTYERDKAFLENTLSKMEEENVRTAVLVTGGYHTEHLARLLQKRDVSYVSIRPQVLHETDHGRYENLLLSQDVNALRPRVNALNLPRAPYRTEITQTLKELPEASETSKVPNGSRFNLSGFWKRLFRRECSNVEISDEEKSAAIKRFHAAYDEFVAAFPEELHAFYPSPAYVKRASRRSFHGFRYLFHGRSYVAFSSKRYPHLVFKKLKPEKPPALFYRSVLELQYILHWLTQTEEVIVDGLRLHKIIGIAPFAYQDGVFVQIKRSMDKTGIALSELAQTKRDLKSALKAFDID